MIYERRYVQFNDLVFDGADMISDWDGEISFKGSSTEYSYTHGSYRPFKRNYLFVAEANVSMTITLNMRKIPCDQRRYYIRFVNEELSKPGKLWSIKNDTLLWAVAAADSISENFSSSQDKLVYNVNFVIPGGIWYKADGRKTFLVPYNVCDLMDCKGYKDVDNCNCCDTCTEDRLNTHDCSCCCNDSICEDMALCHHLDELQEYYSCFVPYRIVYDCERAERWLNQKYFGHKLCVEDICEDSVIAGQIYSDTEIPTEDVSVILSGKAHNPWITINGNTNIIEGDYDGDLIIKSNGDVYYLEGGNECCEPQLLDSTVWTIPEGNTWGWTINPGNNGVMVQLNECCVQATCIYIQYEPIAL